MSNELYKSKSFVKSQSMLCSTLHFRRAAVTLMQIDIIADYWPSGPVEQGFGLHPQGYEGQQSAVTAYHRV